MSVSPVTARSWIRAVTGETDIPSPTFSLVQEYYCTSPHPILYHADLYRLTKPQDLEELGFEEMCTDGICLIEWASRVPQFLGTVSVPVALLWLEFSGEQQRNVHFESGYPLWCNLAEAAGLERFCD